MSHPDDWCLWRLLGSLWGARHGWGQTLSELGSSGFPLYLPPSPASPGSPAWCLLSSGCQTGGTRWALPPPGSKLLPGRHGFLLLPTRRHLYRTCSLTFAESNAGGELHSVHWDRTSLQSLPCASPRTPTLLRPRLVCPYPPGACVPASPCPMAEHPVWDSHSREPEPVCVLVQPPGAATNTLTCLTRWHGRCHTAGG